MEQIIKYFLRIHQLKTKSLSRSPR